MVYHSPPRRFTQKVIVLTMIAGMLANKPFRGSAKI
jgi:hypothetical protein